MQPPHRRVALLAGAGGNPGSAALRSLLGDARYDQVTVLTTCHFLQVPSRLAWAVVKEGHWADALPEADHAVIVLGATRRAREVVYWQPAREDLLPLATALRARGVRSLDVVLIADNGLQPHERSALQALAFEQLSETAPGLLPRPAATNAPWPERLALWLIRTLIATLQMAQVAYRKNPADTSDGRRREP